MSRRRCCCNTESGGPYPCQPCQTPKYRYRFDLVVEGILPDMAGSGVINIGVGDAPSCLYGGCGRIPLRNHSIRTPVFFGGEECFDLICETVLDTPAPSFAAEMFVEWDWCLADRPLCDYLFDTSEGVDCLPNIYFDYEGPIAFGIRTNKKWNFANCLPDSSLPNNDCVTLIYLTFTYDYTFTGPGVYSGDDPPCSVANRTFRINVQWDCVYGRRVAPNEEYAVGSYILLSCQYPAAVPTIGPDGQPCSIASGIGCATSWSSPATIPTLWKPPSNVTLNRV